MKARGTWLRIAIYLKSSWYTVILFQFFDVVYPSVDGMIAVPDNPCDCLFSSCGKTDSVRGWRRRLWSSGFVASYGCYISVGKRNRRVTAIVYRPVDKITEYRRVNDPLTGWFVMSNDPYLKLYMHLWFKYRNSAYESRNSVIFRDGSRETEGVVKTCFYACFCSEIDRLRTFASSIAGRRSVCGIGWSGAGDNPASFGFPTVRDFLTRAFIHSYGVSTCETIWINSS